ncbi:MAG: phosphoribosyltransferase family protein, partial [Nitrospirota bacterium]|nr:phosphoribosyltransferase family protein [Nitrospirota bacterium]
MLIKYKDTNSIVLGIPSGGVPVASEIADALHLTIDFIIVRKIQIPYNPEAGFGAVGPDGEVILNERLLGQMGLTDTEKNAQIKKTKEIIKRRNQLFRGERPPPLLKDKNVIVV